MFRMFLYVFMMSLSLSALANKENQEYEFKYQLSGSSLSIKRAAPTYDDAYKMAASDCFQFYKKHSKLTEEKGLAIIDVCANPKL